MTATKVSFGAIRGQRSMKRISTPSREQEPVGIVISRGSRAEELPIVWAYFWEPAPELPDDGVEAPAP